MKNSIWKMTQQLINEMKISGRKSPELKYPDDAEQLIKMIDACIRVYRFNTFVNKEESEYE